MRRSVAHFGRDKNSSIRRFCAKQCRPDQDSIKKKNMSMIDMLDLFRPLQWLFLLVYYRNDKSNDIKYALLFVVFIIFK